MNRLICVAFAVMIASPALACEDVRLGDLVISHAWSRATIGADRPGVIYLTIRNDGSVDDALTRIATPAAGMAMLHETVVTDGVASMPHAMRVPVTAGETAALAPGGFHGMLMGLTGALEKGTTIPLTLTFETAGEVTITVPVLAFTAKEPDCPATAP